VSHPLQSLPSVENGTGRPTTAPRPTFAEAFRFWLKLGFINFGGPTGQIAIMHAELVEKRSWISNAQFVHALNYCMLLPGPEAQQLSIYIGWLLHGTRGGIAAGTLFVLPSAFILWLLSYVYVTSGHVGWVASIFEGLKPAVVAIVVAAVLRIGRNALKNGWMWLIATAAFVALFFFKTPFPLVICSAALLGWLGGMCAPQIFEARDRSDQTGIDSDADGAPRSSTHHKMTLLRGLRIGAVGLVIWWTPLIALMLWLGRDHALSREAIFFSKAALITVGGAYAVLPYVSQQAVESYHWLSAGQMLDGLALAETTPGPLIMVLQFVGFLGGWNAPGNLTPLWSATLGAAISTWATFVPSFLFILIGAPSIERLRGNRHLHATLSAVTAAVVGVILNLAVWFGATVFFPGVRAINLFALLVCIIALAGLLRWKWNIVWVVICAGAAGLLYDTLR
jgi:chromate transporter